MIYIFLKIVISLLLIIIGFWIAIEDRKLKIYHFSKVALLILIIAIFNGAIVFIDFSEQLHSINVERKLKLKHESKFCKKLEHEIDSYYDERKEVLNFLLVFASNMHWDNIENYRKSYPKENFQGECFVHAERAYLGVLKLHLQIIQIFHNNLKEMKDFYFNEVGLKMQEELLDLFDWYSIIEETCTKTSEAFSLSYRNLLNDLPQITNNSAKTQEVKNYIYESGLQKLRYIELCYIYDDGLVKKYSKLINSLPDKVKERENIKELEIDVVLKDIQELIKSLKNEVLRRN